MCVPASALKLTLIVVVLVALLFFFHGLQGGFQAAHGPTSTLKECAIGLLWQSLILLLAHIILGPSICRLDGNLALFPAASDSPPAALPAPAPLRC